MMNYSIRKISGKNLTVFGATNNKTNGTSRSICSVIDGLHHIIQIAFHIKSKLDAVVCPRLMYTTIQIGFYQILIRHHISTKSDNAIIYLCYLSQLCLSLKCCHGTDVVAVLHLIVPVVEVAVVQVQVPSVRRRVLSVSGTLSYS